MSFTHHPHTYPQFLSFSARNPILKLFSVVADIRLADKNTPLNGRSFEHSNGQR